MRWKSGEPKRGDSRVVRRFAFLPKHFAINGVTVWLEFYDVVQNYSGGGWMDCYPKLINHE